ncbi:MAG TPA: hypothetical protein PK990_05180 [Salinivirgaceae bacterium]|nr:hypothetical protein [Salinivirgaceae bacterium]
MKACDFNELIENVNIPNKESLSDIDSLLSEYPWFQAGHLLMIQWLHLNQDIRFRNRLHMAAAHLPDREKLYYLLQTLKSELEQKNKTEEKVIVPLHPSDAVTEKVDMQNTFIEIDRKLRINEIELFIKEHGMLFFDFPINDDPNREKNIKSTSVPSFDILAEIEKLPDKKIEIEQPMDDKLRKIARQQSIIQRFIEEKPKIIPKMVTEPSEPVDIAKDSVQEKFDFLTESLAKIYVKQKLFDKAIDIYSKLSLKYPEKSSYFAEQIEEVKKLKISNA